MLLTALHRHCPMRSDEAWTLAAYDAAKMAARAAISWDNMRKKMA